jgi:hypothetical protein
MNDRKRRLVRMAGPLAALVLGAAGPAFAVPFENVFGPPTAADRAARRVTPVQVCPGAGFVAVGTTQPPAGGGTADIYFVRTAADGSTVWERTYDVGPGGSDRGQALAEARDGSGFILGGTTNLGAPSDDVVLIKVSCDGTLLWSNRYLSGLPETLADLVEARTGDPAFGTRAGDILLAGMTLNPGAVNRDGFLMRVRGDGALLWNRRYDVGNASEVFRGLTEARPIPGAPTTTGDVVAAGGSTLGGSLQGYALRVSGNNGLILAAPHAGALYGATGTEIFESVVELRNTTAQPGPLVFFGNTTGTAGGSDIYLLRTAPHPAVPVVQRRIGAPATAALGQEAVLDGVQTRFNLPFAPVGSLALTGRVGPTGSTAADAFLLAANPMSLVPLAGTGRLFGDHGPRRDWGVSLSDHAAGFVVAGLSESNFEGAFPPDPSDVYLVGADNTGSTGCSEDWTVPNVTIWFPVTQVTPYSAPFLTVVPEQVREQRLDTIVPHCR